MKHMEIFEQAMCCPTGLCGPSIDPELLRVSTVLDTLKQHGIDVGRYNLTSAPLKFVQTKAVTDFLQHHGPEDLPLILVDGTVQFAGRYPTNDEFASLIGFDPAILDEAQAAADNGCCGDSTDARLPAAAAMHRLKVKLLPVVVAMHRRNRKARRAAAEVTASDPL